MSHTTSNRPETRRRARPQLERLEERCTPVVYRSIDGTGNNPDHPNWGSAGVALRREAPAAYADGIDQPGGGNRPSAREISNTIVAQTTDERIINDRFMSAMIYGFGQFLDHDIDLTNDANPAQWFNVVVPANADDPFSTAYNPPGPGLIFLNRSESVPGTGAGTSRPRQQPNDITAFIDGSMIYGSDGVVARALRTFSGGRLKTSPGPDNTFGTQDDLLPYTSLKYFTQAQIDALNMANPVGLPPDQLFAAGDVRANENIELTSLQTLFVREHNRLAGRIQAAAPWLSDEEIYQAARAIVGGELQAITYNEWLPALLGRDPLSDYRVYDRTVNPGIANEFSTALFRLGHSMLGQDIEFMDNNGEELAEEMPLRDAFFNPAGVTAFGIGPILKYLATDPSSEVDNSIVPDVRDFLFGQPGAGGFDLASLNIQRGRDHGLADYNTVRAAYGLPRVTSFSQISSDPAVQAALKQLYGNVNNIDLWVGALAEDHVRGSSTGPLIRAALIDQFERLRDGDRFWYQRTLDPDTERFVENTSLADVIARNTEINNLQGNVFFFRLSVSGTVFNDADRDGRRDPGENGLAGRTMQLYSVEDGTAVLMAETTTDRNGFYSFDVADGMGPGTWRVREVVPSGWQQTTGDPDDTEFTRGGQSDTADFGNARVIIGTAPAGIMAASADPTVGAVDSTGLGSVSPTGPAPADVTAQAGDIAVTTLGLGTSSDVPSAGKPTDAALSQPIAGADESAFPSDILSGFGEPTDGLLIV